MWQSALNASRIECGRWPSLPEELGSRARAATCGHVAAPDPPGGVSVFSLLRGPDSMWGSGTPWGVRGPRPFWSGALSSLGHVVTPDLSRAGSRSGAIGPVRWSWTPGTRLLSSLEHSNGELLESCHRKRGYPSPEVPTVTPGPTLGEVRTRRWGHYHDAMLIALACPCRERVLRTPSRP